MKLTCGKRGLSSLDFLMQSATSLFMALGELLYSLLKSGDMYPRPTMKIIWAEREREILNIYKCSFSGSDAICAAIHSAKALLKAVQLSGWGWDKKIEMSLCQGQGPGLRGWEALNIDHPWPSTHSRAKAQRRKGTWNKPIGMWTAHKRLRVIRRSSPLQPSPVPSRLTVGVYGED